MPAKNHFATLGVAVGASEDDIKKAYRTMAKKWHPDKNKAPGAKEKFQEIAASYEYLSSADRREMHERELRKPQQAGPSKAASQSQAHTHTQKETNPNTSGKSAPSSKKDRKKQDEGSWSESFTKNYKNQQGKSASRGGATFDSTPGGPGFHFTFEEHGTTSPSQADDIFEELFGDFFSAMGFGVGPGGLAGGLSQPKRSRPRHVAPEAGPSTGLDEEYLFSPRSKSDDGVFGEKLPCPWCGQTFTRGKLGQHEEKCGKFGLSADEDDDENSDVDDIDEDINFFRPLERPSFPGSTNWQRQHEQLRSQIQRDKRLYRDRMASQGVRNSGYIQCPYCERSFNHVAASKHIPWCKEHFHRYGRPMNPRHPGNAGPSQDSPGTSRQDSHHHSQARPGASRDRGKEYAKTIPKPGSKKDTYDSDESEDSGLPKDGNRRKFPYRAQMNGEFEVSGLKFGARLDQDKTGRTKAHFKFSAPTTEKCGMESSRKPFRPAPGVNIKVSLGAKVSSSGEKTGSYSSSFKTKRS